MKLAGILSMVIFFQCVAGMTQLLGKISLGSTENDTGNYTIKSQGAFLCFNEQVNEQVNTTTENEKKLTLESQTLVGYRQLGKFIFPFGQITATDSEDSYNIIGNISKDIQSQFSSHTTVKLKYLNVFKDYDEYEKNPHVIMFYLPEQNFSETIEGIQKPIILSKLDSILCEVNKNLLLKYALSGSTNVNILVNPRYTLTLNNDNSQLNQNTKNSMIFYIGNNSSVVLESEKCLSGAITEFVGYINRKTATDLQNTNVVINTQIIVKNQTVICNNVELSGKQFVIDTDGVICFSTDDSL